MSLRRKYQVLKAQVDCFTEDVKHMRNELSSMKRFIDNTLVKSTRFLLQTELDYVEDSFLDNILPFKKLKPLCEYCGERMTVSQLTDVSHGVYVQSTNEEKQHLPSSENRTELLVLACHNCGGDTIYMHTKKGPSK
jgi:hypothetical protein